MKRIAKLVVIDKDEKYLLMYRSDHPIFGNDPDIPGGLVEDGELPLETMLREVQEETGITIAKTKIKKVYSGNDYSRHGTHYSLFIVKLNEKPEIVISWEHSSYEWLGRSAFLEQAINAKDTYMHMVHDVLK